jgi:Uma2 family endonuclease
MSANPVLSEPNVSSVEPQVGQPMSAAEFAQLPKFARKYELIQGVIIVSPAGLKHDNIAAKLIMRIGMYLLTNPIGEFYATSAGFQITPNVVLSPDGAFVSQERLAGKPSPEGFAPYGPDLAIEVISPSDSANDIAEKVELYLDHGTQLVWVINPRLQNAMVYRPDGSGNRIQPSDELKGENVLPGFICKLSDIL